MKKITFLLLAVFTIIGLNAQIVYQTVLTDNFETTDGYKTIFTVKAQTAWNTVTDPAISNPADPNYANRFLYTGTIWKDVFSDVKPASKKTYTTSIAAENRTGGTGTQCIKFDIKNESFTDMTPYDTLRVVRWRGADGKISFNTTANEGISKYEVSFWARTDGDDKEVLMNTKDPLSKLKLTSTWQKFTIERYTTGTTSTALGIDFCNTLYPAVDNTTGFTVYIDEFIVKQRLIAYTTTASNIAANSFTANWTAVVGANSYSVIVEKTDGAATPTWTPVVGSPFVAGNVQTLAISNLDAGTYRYRVTATDGSVTTVESNNSFATLIASGLNDIVINTLYVQNGVIYLNANSNQNIEVYNAVGQRIYNSVVTEGVNRIQLQQKGTFIVKAGNEIRKIVL